MRAMLWRDLDSKTCRERGASVVEYALLVALIAVVCISAVFVFGGETNRKFEHIRDNISAVN